MLVEIDTLPPIVQRYIEAGEKITLSNHGKVVGEFVTAANLPTSNMLKSSVKSYVNGDFSFDLEGMKKAVEAPYVVAPKFESDEAFFDWLANIKDEDFIAEKI